jgi:AcrR family transcriptional regulator
MLGAMGESHRGHPSSHGGEILLTTASFLRTLGGVRSADDAAGGRGHPERHMTSLGPRELPMQREERREQVLRSAMEVFAHKGYHATSIGDIIKRARIARGTFYLYFENKRQIFEAILEMALQGLVSRLRRIELSPQSPPPLDQLRANVGRVIAFLLSERELTQILLRHAEGLDAEFDRRLSAFYETITNLIEGVLRAGQLMALVRPCDKRIVAACILGSVKEVMARVTSGASQTPALEVVVDEVVNFGLRGIFYDQKQELQGPEERGKWT